MIIITNMYLGLEILGEYQCGFRQQRTTDQLLVVRQILENFYAHDIDRHLIFIDFKKKLFTA